MGRHLCTCLLAFTVSVGPVVQENGIVRDKVYVDGEAYVVIVRPIDERHSVGTTLHYVQKKGRLNTFEISIVNDTDGRIDFKPNRDFVVVFRESAGREVKYENATVLDQREASKKLARKASSRYVWAAAFSGIAAGFSDAAGDQQGRYWNKVYERDAYQKASHTAESTYEVQMARHIGRTTIMPSDSLEGFITVKSPGSFFNLDKVVLTAGDLEFEFDPANFRN